MENQEQIGFNEMVHQAQELGLLNYNLTVICVNCKAAFPNEYGDCPRCQMDDSAPSQKEDFEF